jgi:hypothetical protein
MKKLLLIFTLLFSTLMFSTPSYAEWTQVSGDKEGNIFYVDFERIRKLDGYVYFWRLNDSLKPRYGDLSSKVYNQGDCKLFRYKWLSVSFHKEHMGKGTGENEEITGKHKDWRYPPPNSGNETILKSVCGQ